MNNKALLIQARKGIKKLIKENPIKITILTYPLVSDGMGGTVQDPYGVPVPSVKKVRISHERRGPFSNDEKPSGLSTNLSRFILSDYQTKLVEGSKVSDFEDREYEIGPCDPLIKFGGVYGYQAPLIEGNHV